MKRLKGITLLALILICGINGFAQQDPMYTQYLNNLVTINPAYAGSRGTFNMLALHRQQWVGIDGAPQTMTLSMNTPFKVFHVGVGLSVVHDVIGPLRQTSIYADYAYHLNLTKKTKLSLGVKAGGNLFDMDLTKLEGATHDDYIAQFGDRSLLLPNFGIGMYLYSDKYYLGLSSPKLLTNDLTKADALTQVNKEERHYFLMGALLLRASDYIKFKPSFIARVVEGSPLSLELTGAIILDDKIWLGGMYRFGDSFGGFIQFQLGPQVKLGYAYDLTQSKLRNYNSGTHEVMISYDFSFSKKKILSPRFF